METCHLFLQASPSRSSIVDQIAKARETIKQTLKMVSCNVHELGNEIELDVSIQGSLLASTIFQ